MSLNAMRQIEERHIANEIEIASWCTRLDLLALSNNKGEVVLHRLNWQKVWSLPSPAEGIIVKALAWRPDGKVLAVAYNSGKVSLIDVENKDLVHSFVVNGTISSLNWVQQGDATTVQNNLNVHKQLSQTLHDHTSFLPRLPSLSTSYTNKKIDMSPDSKYLKDQTTLSMLLVGLDSGLVYISVFGLFPCGFIDLKLYTKYHNGVIINAKLSETFDNMYIFFRADDKINILVLKTPTLSSYSKELHILALKHGHIIHLMHYMQSTINCIVEAWETALLEMDNKLEKYSACVPEGGVSADFLDLLMFGTASVELQTFLLHDLTEKGLKKMGASIELSYSTIQKLVLKNLNTVGQALVYHLSELRGMARLTYTYESLGLDEKLVSQAICDIGSFLVKVGEVQQVIDHSMKNYKAFFRWLYVVIVRLMDERVPHEIAEMSQQEIKYIAEFLDNIDGFIENPEKKDETIKVRPFNLERLGQYLEDSNLTIPPDFDKNPWHDFLKANECISSYPDVIQHHENHSLIQEHKQFIKSVQQIFEKPPELIGNNFKTNGVIQYTGLYDSKQLCVDQINIPHKDSVLFSFLDKSVEENGIFIIEYQASNNQTKAAHFYFNPPPAFNDSKLPKDLPPLKPIDIQFYTSDICSILLQQPNSNQNSLFIQFNLSMVKDKLFHIRDIDTSNMIIVDKNSVPSHNAFEIIDACSMRLIENMVCNGFAVSSSRKVAIVLSNARKKIRLYEMEVEEDEEEEDFDVSKDSENSVLNSSKESACP